MMLEDALKRDPVPELEPDQRLAGGAISDRQRTSFDWFDRGEPVFQLEPDRFSYG